MTEYENSVYGGIYDIVNENMISNDERLEYTKERYLLAVEGNPNFVDLIRFSELSNEDFLFIAYVTLLNRIPEKLAYQSWAKALNLPKNEFQKSIIDGILQSNEFINGRINVLHNYTSAYNLTSSGNQPENNKLDRLKNNGKVYRLLYNIYRRLPIRIKLALRKLIGINTI